MTDTTNFRENLRQLVAEGRLKEATQQVVQATENIQSKRYYKMVVSHSVTLDAYLKAVKTDSLDYETLIRKKSQLTLNLLALINGLPEDALSGPAATPKPGVSEPKLKRRIFWLLLVGKALVIAFAFFQYDTGGGLSYEDLITVIGIIIPMFGAYLTLAFQEITHNRRLLDLHEERVSRDFAIMAYLVVVIYPLLVGILLYMRSKGMISGMVGLMGALGIVESAWGVYVSKVVFGLFNGKE